MTLQRGVKKVLCMAGKDGAYDGGALMGALGGRGMAIGPGCGLCANVRRGGTFVLCGKPGARTCGSELDLSLGGVRRNARCSYFY